MLKDHLDLRHLLVARRIDDALARFYEYRHTSPTRMGKFKPDFEIGFYGGFFIHPFDAAIAVLLRAECFTRDLGMGKRLDRFEQCGAGGANSIRAHVARLIHRNKRDHLE